MLEEIFEFNKKFVENRGYEKYIINKYFDKKIVIFFCMDICLIELLFVVLGIYNGDVKIIKNVGVVIFYFFGSVICSLLVVIIELGVEEVMVIVYFDCGVCYMNSDEMIIYMKKWGIKFEIIDMICYCGVDFNLWLGGFDDLVKFVRGMVCFIENYLFILKDVWVYGFIIDLLIGELMRVE